MLSHEDFKTNFKITLLHQGAGRHEVREKATRVLKISLGFSDAFPLYRGHIIQNAKSKSIELSGCTKFPLFKGSEADWVHQ